MAHPLNEEHYNNIVAALASLEQADEHARLARMAGIDVSAEEADMKALRAKLTQIKNVYFPNR